MADADLALTRFKLIQPCLEEGIALAELARQQAIRFCRKFCVEGPERTVAPLYGETYAASA